jgi:hypothetical protein
LTPPGAHSSATDLADGYFSRSIPIGVEVVIRGADQRDALRRALEQY